MEALASAGAASPELLKAPLVTRAGLPPFKRNRYGNEDKGSLGWVPSSDQNALAQARSPRPPSHVTWASSTAHSAEGPKLRRAKRPKLRRPARARALSASHNFKTGERGGMGGRRGRGGEGGRRGG